jgi:CRISPR-associated protein Csh1
MNVALKHISKFLADTESEEGGQSSEFIEKLKDSFKKVIAIELEEVADGTGYRLGHVSLETFDVERQGKYLFRGGDTSNPGFTVTRRLGKPNKKDKIQKEPRDFVITALDNKIMRYLRGMAQSAATTSGQNFAVSVLAALEGDYESILENVIKYAEQIVPSKEDAIITVVICNEGVRKYPQDIEPLREYFTQLADPESGVIKEWRSEGNNAICSCCSNQFEKVRCRPPDLKLPYFTCDKPGFIAGGFFDMREFQEKGWRNFPLCRECELGIRSGFKAVEEKLQFSFYGIKYLLIPNFTDWQSSAAQTVLQVVASLGRVADLSEQREQEELFVHRLSRAETTALLNFIFYKKKQSRFEILCTLENILPSRLSEIAEAIDRAGRHDLLARFGEWSRATKIESIHVNFGLLKDLYQPHLKTRGDKAVNIFLRAVQRVVYGQPFDAREFFDAAMRYIRDELREQQSEGKEPWLTWATHKVLAAAFWLLRLGLLRLVPPSDGTSAERGDAMTDYPQLNAESLNESFDEFFQAFNGLFTREEQRACYLMGVLCAQVLSEQRKRYQNRQPFFRHLKDLNLDEAEMRGLLPKLKSKLVEYEKDHFNWGLEKAIAERFRLAGSPWQLTNSEINFFFTLGLCEAPLFSARAANEANTSE